MNEPAAKIYVTISFAAPILPSEKKIMEDNKLSIEDVVNGMKEFTEEHIKELGNNMEDLEVNVRFEEQC